MTLKTRLIALVLPMLVVAVPNGAATTKPSLVVGVNVALSPSTVKLSTKSVARGYYVEFKVKNTTAKRRVFSMAGRTIAIPPRKYRLLVISFDVRGTYKYASRYPGGAPIRGTFVVS